MTDAAVSSGSADQNCSRCRFSRSIHAMWTICRRWPPTPFIVTGERWLSVTAG